MVDRQAREMGAEILRRFADGELTNDQFEDTFPYSKADAALREIRLAMWFTYSDLKEHRLTGKYNLSEELKQTVDRTITFLRSDLEYEWPQSELSLLELVKNVLTIGAYSRRADREYKASGDYDVWPFLRRADFERALKTCPSERP